MIQPTRYGAHRREVWNIDAFQPCVFLECIGEHGITALRLTPAMATLLIEEMRLRGDRYDVSSVARIKLSAAYSPPALFSELHQIFPGAQIL